MASSTSSSAALWACGFQCKIPWWYSGKILYECVYIYIHSYFLGISWHIYICIYVLPTKINDHGWSWRLLSAWYQQPWPWLNCNLQISLGNYDIIVAILSIDRENRIHSEDILRMYMTNKLAVLLNNRKMRWNMLIIPWICGYSSLFSVPPICSLSFILKSPDAKQFIFRFIVDSYTYLYFILASFILQFHNLSIYLGTLY